ncbi:MAG: hypothetical protein O9272_14780 [Brevundimonas sp.]|nr:hypothetical protein [Brevundimonas sp.]
MEAREEFSRLMAWLIENSDEVESDQIRADIMLLQGAAGQLVSKLAERNAALAKQCRPRKSKPSKSAPVSGPQQRKQPASSTDTPSSQKDAEDRSKELSSIQQGIRQADPSLADQQRAMRGFVYGAQNDEVAFRKAAQAIAR